MRENLEEMARLGLEVPVLLGGAALTRNYVEDDCVRAYGADTGRVAYARDAFDGLHLMDKVTGNGFDDYLAAIRRSGWASRATRAARWAPPTRAASRRWTSRRSGAAPPRHRRRADPRPALLGRPGDGIRAEGGGALHQRAQPLQFQWGFRKQGRSLEDFLGWAKQELRPVLKRMLALAEAQDILRPQAIYGYWKCAGQGNDLVLFEQDGGPRPAASPCRGSRSRMASASPTSSATSTTRARDVIGLQVVTVGQKASDMARDWFEDNRYQDYLYLHGLSVEMAEAMAEYVHKRIRSELGFAGEDDRDMDKMLSQGYRGGRYSFGYPACPKLEDQVPLLKLLDAERIGVTHQRRVAAAPGAIDQRDRAAPPAGEVLLGVTRAREAAPPARLPVRRLVRADILVPLDRQPVPGGELLARPFPPDIDLEAIGGGFHIARLAVVEPEVLRQRLRLFPHVAFAHRRAPSVRLI